MMAGTRRCSKITPRNRGQHPRANDYHYRDLRFAIHGVLHGDRNLAVGTFSPGFALKGLRGRQRPVKMPRRVSCRLGMAICL
jgi:hypothetical protein